MHEHYISTSRLLFSYWTCPVSQSQETVGHWWLQSFFSAGHCKCVCLNCTFVTKLSFLSMDCWLTLFQAFEGEHSNVMDMWCTDPYIPVTGFPHRSTTNRDFWGVCVGVIGISPWSLFRCLHSTRSVSSHPEKQRLCQPDPFLILLPALLHPPLSLPSLMHHSHSCPLIHSVKG